MAEIASAFVSLLPSTRGFGQKLDGQIGGDIDAVGKKSGSRFGTALKGGALAVLGGAAIAGTFLKGALDEARDAQKVGALTNAVIKSTGGVANVTAKDVDRLATSISNKTGVDDEAIAAGQNMLLTFGNVRNEVGKGNDIFSQATVAATDMAAAFGGDAVSNSKMLGKALNDPTKGVSALTRVGVSFTEQQKEQITALQKSGDMLGAQKIILGELSKQTAGAAESQATAGQKFSTIWGNFQESIGSALLPTVDKILTALGKFVIFLTNDIGPGIAALNGYFAPAVTAVKAFFGSLASGSGPAGGLVATLQAKLIPALQAVVGAFRNDIVPAVVAFVSTVAAQVMPVVQRLAAVFTTVILPAFISLGQAIVANVIPILQTMAATFTTVILPAFLRLVGFVTSSLVPVFQQIADVVTTKVVPILSALAQFFVGQVIPSVVAVAQSVAAKLRPVFEQLVATFTGRVLPTVNKLLAKFQEYQPTIQKTVSEVVKFAGKVLVLAAAIAGKVLPVAIRFAGFLIANVVPAVASVVVVVIKIIGRLAAFGSALVDAVSSAGRFLSGVKDKIGAALEFIQSIPGKVKSAFSGAGTILLSVGRDIVQGLVNGIRNAAGAVYDAAMALVDKIPGPIRKIMGIASPSKVMLKIGNQIGEGLTLGITAKAPAAAAAAKEAAEKTAKAAAAAAEKARKALSDKWSGIVSDWRDAFKTLKSDMASLSDSVASAFNPDMFGVVGKAADELAPATTALQEFMSGLTGNNSNLTAMLDAFEALKGKVSTDFLTSLFQSGNTALAAQLAADPATAAAASKLFGENAALADKLGGNVAVNEYGPEIRDEMKALNKKMEDAPKKYAKELKSIFDRLELVVQGGNPGQRAYLRTGK